MFETAQPGQSPVTLSVSDGIGVVTIDSPPMNTLSVAVRGGLFDAVKAATEDDACQAILIVCNGRTFIAGAEIKEFGKPRQPPATAEVVKLIEACEKPVIASIHGSALGGGLEFALGCHYRLALSSAKVGLPEVSLGILPGGGGTQRLPRLIGVEAALDIILSARHVAAREALELGILDEIDEGSDPLEAGLAFARKAIREGLPARSIHKMPNPTIPGGPNGEILAKALKGLERKARGQVSPYKAVECVQAAMTLPFKEGLQFERDRFLECMDTPQRQALVHAFFAERQTRKLPEIAGIRPGKVGSVGIVGGGTMGAGIAVSLLNNGFRVVLVEQDSDSVERAVANIERVYARAIKRGRMTEADRDVLLERQLVCSSDFEALGPTDVVIEAVFENMGVKKDIFKRLDATLKPGAILATNTSRLDVDEIASVTGRPEDVIGLHFFSPANVMKLVEVIVGNATSAQVLATCFDLVKRMGKVGVRSGVCDGFIGNRIVAQYKKVADYLIEDGVSPYDLDKAVVRFGYAMGPFQVADLAGLDISWASRKRLAETRDPRERYVRIADRVCENGWFGQKTGRGFYIYDESSPRGRPNPDVEAIVEEERKQKGIIPRSFSEDEIMLRLMASLINEGANVLEDGIARRPSDIDVTLLLGYGFPRWRGGPMKYADMIGLDRIQAEIDRNSQEDPFFWKPSPLLKRLVDVGENFDSLNNSSGKPL